LCEDAKSTLDKFTARYALEIETIDIEKDPALFAEYRYEIPVIFLEGRKLFKYRVDEKKFEEALRREIRNFKNENPK
jgi:hypothetical protein